MTLEILVSLKTMETNRLAPEKVAMHSKGTTLISMRDDRRHSSVDSALTLSIDAKWTLTVFLPPASEG